jgi:rhodanese-related sulfurtransferase
MKHLLILALLLIVSATSSQAQSDWRSLITGDSFDGYSVEGVTKINISVAKSMHDSGALFVDTRGGPVWASGHITGALSCKVVNEEFLQENLNKSDPVVFYCEGSGCKLAPDASAKTLSLGYENVYYLAEGISGWISAGHQTE